MALFGLLLVSAISTAGAAGRKPAEEVKVSMRHISTSEAMDILRKFPELVPDHLAAKRNDADYMAGTFGFVEVTAAPLTRVFSTARFYKGHDFWKPPQPYMMAVADGKRYMIPGDFNRLLLDNGLEVTDKNIVELAETFVIAAIGDESRSFPEITFLDATRTKLKAGLPTDDAAILKVKTGEETEEWHFSVLRGQFEGAARVNEKGLIKDFPSVIVESLPGRGQ
ncbi:MAG: hypothetical protein NTX53_13775 [candidate division WOR-3 bacterium]|nr:hypothetical protein [candidate division WOR-3 bacterium]